MGKNEGWIGVDLDGTLAKYNGWKGETHIGPPIEPIVKAVQEALRNSVKIKVFTARVANPDDREAVERAIQDWCFQHIGQVLEVTNEKDFAMIELWDDRCKQVRHNTGIFIEDLLHHTQKALHAHLGTEI